MMPRSMSYGDFVITVPSEAAGERLDSFISTQLDGVSRSSVRRAIDEDDCLVNDSPAKASYKVRAGDTIQVEIAPPPSLDAEPEEIPLTIVHEDETLVVVDKPAGMVIHPGAGVRSGTLANALVWHFNNLPGRERHRPGIVHRLDVGTSGLVVVAKTENAHQHLAQQFEARTVDKRYIALVYGQTPTEGRIDAPIGRDPINRVKMAVNSKGRPALTLFRTIESLDGFSLLEVQIKTGRTHQIRVHLAHLNHPIAGDPTYDRGRLSSIRNTETRSQVARLGRPFLHAAKLSFIHPDGKRLSFTATLPPELEELLSYLRKLS